jgi:hypothetical protein
MHAHDVSVFSIQITLFKYKYLNYTPASRKGVYCFTSVRLSALPSVRPSFRPSVSRSVRTSVVPSDVPSVRPRYFSLHISQELLMAEI